MNTSVAQCRYLLLQAESILRDLNDAHRSLEPQAGSKTAGWLIGHLCVTGDFARRLCGQPPLCPAEWRTAFNPGTQPSTRADDYPSMTALCDAFRAVYSDLSSAALSADQAILAKDNPYVAGRAAFPTSGDFVGYLLAGHLGYHLGQLSTWRAAAGMRPLNRSNAPVA